MYKFSKRFIALAAKLKSKTIIGVVHPCSAYAICGAIEIKKENLGIPILIGPSHKIKALAMQNKLDISGIKIINVPHSHAAVEEAIELVKQDKVQLLMKGSLHTDELMHPILDSKTGIKTDGRVTHCCVLDIPKFDRPLLIADIALNILPDLNTKVYITQNAINLGIALGLTKIKVAILSADEQVRSQIPSSIDAAALSKMSERRQITGAIIDGPLSFDAAISESASNVKEINSKIAGGADILIVPNIEAGNIMVKEFVYFSKAIMPGIIMGTKVPIILTSRADNATTRTSSCALGILYMEWLQKYLKEKNEGSNG
jgi:phosphate acetyltransferase